MSGGIFFTAERGTRALVRMGIACLFVVACAGEPGEAVPTERELSIFTEVVLIEAILQDFSGPTKDTLTVRFHEHTAADILRTNDINATAPQLIARAFLPSMIERGRGHFCNVASSAGLLANPKMTVYAGSKWSLVGFSESLRVEVEQLGLPVKVTTVLPYYINTGMFDGVKSKIPILDPEKAAASILEAVARDETMVTLPRYIYRLTRLSQGVLSTRGLDWFAGRVFGVYRTMEGWTGRGA